MPIRLVVEYDASGDNSVVGLPTEIMEELRVADGDYVLVRGERCRQSIGVAARKESSEGRRVFLNNVMCKNLGLRPSADATVCRLDCVVKGECISVQPFADTLDGVSVGDLDLEESYLAPYFKGDLERPVVCGDTFTVPGGTTPIEFKVVDVHPGTSCVVGGETNVLCKRDFLRKKNEKVGPLVFTPMVSVEIRNLKGELLLPREDVLRNTPMSWLKARVKRVAHQAIVEGTQATASQTYIARGCGIKVIYRRRALVDDDTMEDEECFGTFVELTAILFVRTYSVSVWGGRESGGYLDPSSEVYRLTRSAVTKLYGNGRAFAALREGGHVVTWGDKICGGDSSAVEQKLARDVINICGNMFAFAALKEGGIVVPWGDADAGGKLERPVARQLAGGVTKLFCTDAAFAALKDDGSVVTWGNADYGGDSTAVADPLSGDVVSIRGNSAAFAAIKESGSVVAWGDRECGGHIEDEAILRELAVGGVESVHGNGFAFAALKESGVVVVWGSRSHGGIVADEAARDKLAAGDFVSLHCNRYAFAAITREGELVAWGDPEAGGDVATARSALNGIVKVSCNQWAFGALTNSGAVVTWGDRSHGGESSAVAEQLASGVKDIICNEWAFAALRDNGSIVTWGAADSGGDSSSVAAQLTSGVSTLYGNGRTFAALKEDGSIVAWGEPSFGGDASAVQEHLAQGVVALHCNESAYAALKDNGAVFTWGNRLHGGAASTVESKGYAAGNTLSSVADELDIGVSIVHSNGVAFAALKEVGCYVV